jgi:starvation-inducible DNA-binding protein
MKTVDSLKKLFADNFATYVLAHGYHQAVVGDDFYEYHKLFQKIYEYLQDNIDNIGELIRQCDDIAPFSLTRISELSEVKDVQTAPDTVTMVLDLDSAIYMCIEQANQVFEDSNADKEYGVNNFVGGYIQDLNKFCWFLKASSQMTDQGD